MSKNDEFFAIMTQHAPVSAPHAAVDAIRAAAPGFVPRVAIVLGSGLGGLADQVEPVASLRYTDIPGFPAPTVHGHAGRLVLGMLGGQPVACLQGRVHFYEGHSGAPLKTMIRSLKLLGTEILYLTCAAGSLRPDVGPGRLMTISDHINMMGINPLVGANDDEFGPRFPPMAAAWDPALVAHQAATAASLELPVTQGVYIGLLGPTFETPAEVRMIARLGADAVGMSTVPECIVARHCGLRVTGTAAITNLGEGLSDEPLSHEQTLTGAAQAADGLKRLIVRFLETL
jgi:xanthosine phosphorylase